MFAGRLKKLKNGLEKTDMAALAVNAGPTMTYLTGLHFHLMERPVVFVVGRSGQPLFILPELETAKLANLPFPAKIFSYGENPSLWAGTFAKGLQGVARSGEKIGVEPRRLRLLEYDLLRTACPQGEFVDGTAIVATLRTIKDSGEIDAMRRAVVIAQDALEATIAKVKIGTSEKEIAGELLLQLLHHGAEPTLPFQPIVAAGANAANPHAQPSAKKLAAGELLIIDWGACHNGYVSDLTRTFAVGQIDGENLTIYAAVQQANGAGRAAGRPGVACAAVDLAARQCIEAAGYGRFFTHRTGHGLGMECHEEPYIRGDNGQLLEAGMTYTVEPGIYLPGRGGVRIEDDVLVTRHGSESLSTLSRELRVIG